MKILETALQGCAERKVETMTALVYNIGKERLRVVKKKRSSKEIQITNRREQRMKQLRQELKVVRKQYRKVSGSSAVALGSLKDDIREELKKLRIAEQTRKMDDQKIVCSWSLKQMQNITSPTTWCESSQEFITVINNKVIHTWKKDDMDFENSKRRNFKFDIHRVVAVGNWEPVVVCKNGQVDFLSKIKETYKQIETKTDIVYCDAKSVKDSLCVTCVLRKESNILEVQTHWYKTNESWRHQASQVDIPDEQESVSCSCLVEPEEIKLYIHCCSDSESSLYCRCHSEDQFTADSTYQLRSITGIDRKSAIVCIDSTHVAVAGIKQSTKRGIGIYDIKFGTLQSWMPLPDTDSIYKIFCHQGYIFSPCGKSLHAFSYKCQPSSLASIFQLQKLEDDKSIQNERVPLVHHFWNKKKSKTHEGDEEITKLFTKICNRKETGTYKQFQTSFSKLITYLNDDKNTYFYDTHLMKNLVDRCLTEEKFWPQKELKVLIQSRHFPTLCIPQLFDKLTIHSETDLLNTALTTISDVPESCLCKALQYYLGSENRLEKIDTDCSEKEKCPVMEETEHLINHVLILPYNDVFMIECLRKLSFQDVLLLLQYLFYLLGDNERETEDSEPLVKPSMLQVVDWLCIIIDAHITQLIISPDARIILINLHDVVETMVAFYDDLISLEALLQQLKIKSAISQKPKVGQYCIEVLHVH